MCFLLHNYCIGNVHSTDVGTSIDRDRRLLRGLSKVYELRDGAEAMETDKHNILNKSSDPNFYTKNYNINIRLVTALK